MQRTHKLAQTRRAALNAAARAIGQTPMQHVQSLVRPREPHLRALRIDPREQVIEALRTCFEAAPQQLFDALAMPGKTARDFCGIGHQQLGGRRWGRRAEVGGEVRDREVDLVTDCRNDRDCARADRACDRFVVERPQVFERAAAPGQQENIVAARGRRGVQHRDNRGRRVLALDRYRQDFYFSKRETPRDHAEHVANRGAGWRGDYADPARHLRNRSLAIDVEQTLGGELRLELLECALQGAFARFFEAVDNQLEFATRFVQADPGAGQHAHTIAGLEAQPGAARLEHRAAHLCAGVLQGEIQMPGRRAREVRYFAFDPDQRQYVFKQITHETRQCGRRVHLAHGDRVVGRFGHGMRGLRFHDAMRSRRCGNRVSRVCRGGIAAVCAQ